LESVKLGNVVCSLMQKSNSALMINYPLIGTCSGDVTSVNLGNKW